MNYNLRIYEAMNEIQNAVRSHESVSQRSIRSDANVMCDWVVTCPRDCPEASQRDFTNGEVVEFRDDKIKIGH